MAAPIQIGWRFECPVCGGSVYEDEAPICIFCGEPLNWLGDIPTFNTVAEYRHFKERKKIDAVRR